MKKDEFLKKYRNVKVTFSHYNKYVFFFTGFYGDESITVGFGGNANDIYHIDINTNWTPDIDALDPSEGIVYKGDKVVCSFKE